jgi:hypothetical protein
MGLQSVVSTYPVKTSFVPFIPASYSDARSGDPVLKYGPSVWDGVSAAGLVQLIADACGCAV